MSSCYMAEYASEDSEKFIPDKNFIKAILLKLSRPENIDPVKNLYNLLLKSLKQK